MVLSNTAKNNLHAIGHLRWIGLVLICVLVQVASLSAQDSFGFGNQSNQGFGNQFNQSKEEKLRFTGRFHIEKGTRKGFLIIKAIIPKGSYIYGLKQGGGIPPSKFAVLPSAQFRQAGQFKSDKAPKVVEHDPVFETRMEKHMEDTQFYVPLELDVHSDPSTLKPVIQFDGQICSDQGTCMPINNKKIQVKFAGYYERQANRNAGPNATPMGRKRR